MVNYGQWIQRAVAFTERVRTFPGDVGVESRVGPPLSEADLRALEAKFRLPIPAPIRRFLTQGSEDCYCYYYCDPPAPYPERLGEVVSDYLVGGASLCEVNGFDPPDGKPGSVSLAYMLSGLSDMADAVEEWGMTRESELWRNSFPFCHVGNGDLLGLYMDGSRREDDYLVLYIDHDADAELGVYSRFIDESFDTFLSHWEDLFYINPLFLGRFVNKDTGRLDPTSQNARRFQEIMGCFTGGG
jgi:hypothetical protein